MVNRHVGTSGECPICSHAEDDTLHLLFQCPTTHDMWRSLGLNDIIDEAMGVDRAGSAVLEFLL